MPIPVIKLLLLSMVLQAVGVVCQSSDEERRVLYESLRDAIIREKKNMLALQDLFYPPPYFDVGTIQIVICYEDFTVWNISNNGANYSNFDVPAFKYSSSCDCYKRCTDGGCVCKQNDQTPCDVYYESYGISNDASSSSLLRLNNYLYGQVNYHLEVIDFTFFKLISHITSQQQDPSLTDGISTANISLSIDQLSKIPTNAELRGALMSVLTWVSCVCYDKGTFTTLLRMDQDTLYWQVKQAPAMISRW